LGAGVELLVAESRNVLRDSSGFQHRRPAVQRRPLGRTVHGRRGL